MRLLGRGEITAKVTFEVHGASKSAIAAVEKAGGSVKILAPAKKDAGERRNAASSPAPRAVRLPRRGFAKAAIELLSGVCACPRSRPDSARGAGGQHGVSSRTTCSKSQLLGASPRRRNSRSASGSRSVRCSSIGSAPTFRCRASIPTHWSRCSQPQAGGILGMFNMFAGGAVSRMAIFALSIMPYISASIIIQLMTTVVAAARGAEEGRRGGPQEPQPVHPLLTVILAVFQAYGIAVGLEGQPAMSSAIRACSSASRPSSP